MKASVGIRALLASPLLALPLLALTLLASPLLALPLLAVSGCNNQGCNSLPPMPAVFVQIYGAAEAPGCTDDLIRVTHDAGDAEWLCKVDVYVDADCSCSVYADTDGTYQVELLDDGEVVGSETVDVQLGICGPETEATEFEVFGPAPGAGGAR